MTIRTRTATPEYRDGWERCFGRRPVEPEVREALGRNALAFVGGQPAFVPLGAPARCDACGAKADEIRNSRRVVIERAHGLWLCGPCREEDP